MPLAGWCSTGAMGESRTIQTCPNRACVLYNEMVAEWECNTGTQTSTSLKHLAEMVGGRKQGDAYYREMNNGAFRKYFAK